MRRRSAAIAAVALVVIVACSGDDDNETDADASVAPPATATNPARTDGEATLPTDSAPAPTGPASSDATAAGTSAEPAVTLTEVGIAEAPVDLAWREGDAGLYVVEQGGRILRLADGALSTVLDATDLTDADGERGLLGLAFAPSGDLAYTNYTDLNGDTTILEYPVEDDGTFLTGDNARSIFVIEQPYPNHNGGDLTFGPDGLLYIGMGDGGSGGDPERRATDLSTPLGKLLRIDPTPSAGEPYTVPADNPFVGEEGADARIWSSGLRNPWRFSFDRATGDLWIADVGQNAFEEIDVAAATDGVDAGKGLSFGWSAFEGDTRFNDDVPAEGHTPPFAAYPHGDAGCTVSGGVRVRNGSSLDGWYVYADYCSGRIVAQEVLGEGPDLQAGRTVELGTVESPTAVVDGPAGEVYVLSLSGPIYRLDPT